MTSVQRKKAGPTWTPTAKMHAGIRRPRRDPACGLAGPVRTTHGAVRALYIGKMYAIHGTNAQFGIGLRVSHGCVRLRNDDIEYLFKQVPVGTRVQFVNQPIKASVEPDGRRYLEVHQPSPATRRSSTPACRPLPMSTAVTRFIAHADSDPSWSSRPWSSAAACPSPSTADPGCPSIFRPRPLSGLFGCRGGSSDKPFAGRDKIRP